MPEKIQAKNVSVVIPTYCREQVLVNTVETLLELEEPAGEIIIVDQTLEHIPPVTEQLAKWHEKGLITWVRLEKPSIPHAMNQGLLTAKKEIVLYLDDDIIPSPALIACHADNYSDPTVCAVVGQVLQPGQQPVDESRSSRGEGIWRDLDFIFNSNFPDDIHNCMAGNLSVRRDDAINAGGMDENFVGVAYRFETEFAKRLITSSGKRIRFDPKAKIDHLQAASGGTRSTGGHLTSASPVHSVGDYYFAYRHARGRERFSYMVQRFFRSVRTRFHLTHPWWIPVKLLGELRGLLWARELYKAPPKYIEA